jgi:TRAP-type mannitol/chloroaromatic compound transport system permease small subunit
MMRRLAGLIETGIDALGRAVAWLTLLLVLLAFGLVLARYAFGVGSIAAQEAQLWMHSLIFLLGASYALRHGQHVRVDLLYQRLGTRGRAWIDLVGTILFLLPFCVFLLWVSLDYVGASWATREGSREPGGLPGVFLLKTLIPVAAAILALQALAFALRAALVLRGGDAAPAAAPER